MMCNEGLMVANLLMRVGSGSAFVDKLVDFDFAGFLISPEGRIAPCFSCWPNLFDNKSLSIIFSILPSQANDVLTRTILLVASTSAHRPVMP
jgi:hypothetical protein